MAPFELSSQGWTDLAFQLNLACLNSWSTEFCFSIKIQTSRSRTIKQMEWTKVGELFCPVTNQTIRSIWVTRRLPTNSILSFFAALFLLLISPPLFLALFHFQTSAFFSHLAVGITNRMTFTNRRAENVNNRFPRGQKGLYLFFSWRKTK